MKPTRHIFISAGEASGDFHAAGLVKELKAIDSNLQMTGLGGDGLQEEGAKLLYHCRDLAAMGFWEVFRKLRFFLKVRRDCLKVLKTGKPDLVILVDYPGFNLKLAKDASRLGIPVVYFILPQVWAWKPKRTEALKKYCRMLISILPFEKEFFAEYNAQIEYVGHPLIDIIPGDGNASELKSKLGIEEDKKLVCLLPGSRMQELERNLPPMVGAMKFLYKKLDKLQVAIIRARDLSQDLYDSIIADHTGKFHVVEHDKYDYIKTADAAVVASGTATLETAICGTPGVVIYKTSPMTYFLAKRMIKIDMIALANLVAGEKVFPELIQGNARPEMIAKEIEKILTDKSHAEQVKSRLSKIRNRLEPAGAYNRAAKLIYDNFLAK
jgi:lipid-A-disaccharide synthase